ncbi:type VI secretion system protein TssL, long form [Collimonas silvisoli]|uniref:type VI secretion system protein TssL, long form n=1 Tax=Collimonas silvisoli TaxID=2825884 RepID=UPI001B8BC704|nr:type VI secretion system protein TssL, long form [Collimonas silvisoli]
MTDSTEVAPLTPLTGDGLLKLMGNDVPVTRSAPLMGTASDAEKEAVSIEQKIAAIVLKAITTPEQRDARLVKIKAAKNPLLEAAKPLIWMLADIRKTHFTTQIQIESFRRLVQQEVIDFKILCNRADILREHTEIASYCLCTALDEAAVGTKWGGGHGGGDVGVWAGGRMLAEMFHQNRQGGVNFFNFTGGMLSKQDEHRDVLEVQYYILHMGFKGRYRAEVGGEKSLSDIRQHVYERIYANQPPAPAALSPNLPLTAPGKFMPRRHVPVGLVAVVAVLVAFTMFSWYKYQLVTRSEQLVQEITDIGKMTPPPTQAMPLRLAQLLKDEIASGKVIVDESDAGRSSVLFKGDDMFVAGAAKLNADMLSLLDKVATELAKVSGSVQIIGHSDNVPIRTRAFPNNQALSEERAASVGDVLQAAGVAGNRVTIIGRGDSEPLVSNANVVGRAKNRRVEMIVLQPAASSSSAVAATSSR